MITASAAAKAARRSEATSAPRQPGSVKSSPYQASDRPSGGQASVAVRALPSASVSDRAFYEGKKQAARFFAVHELPKVPIWADLLGRADRTTLDMQAGWF